VGLFNAQPTGNVDAATMGILSAAQQPGVVECSTPAVFYRPRHDVVAETQ
jgi:hypothetical protein